MKIMHFISGIQSGGVEQMLINYTSKINEQFNTNQVIVFQHDPNKVCYDKLVNAGNKCIRISNKRTHPLRNVADTIRVIKDEQPDIIHTHMNLLNFIPLFCALLCGVKVRICHSHIANRNIKSKVMENFFKFLNVFFATNLLACGSKAGKYMYGNKKFDIIYNSIDLDNFKFDSSKKDIVRKELGLSKHDQLLGNVGRLTEQKNQKFLLKVMKEIVKKRSDIKLIILGNGELNDDIKNEMKKQNLQNNVILHEPVNNINDYYDAMDIFLLPSLYEGFPVSLVEAQASGVCSIVSETIDCTAKINNNVYFLPNNDVNKWSDAILNHVNNNRTNVNMSDFNDFDISHSYKFLYDIYQKSLNK
jgi:glycosyltransferase involved in cell wall biosynthesis